MGRYHQYKQCPKCTSEDIMDRRSIGYKPFEHDGGRNIYRNMWCNDCGYRWTELFVFEKNIDVEWRGSSVGRAED